MEVKLRKYCNSMVAVLPPGVLKDLGLHAGQAMTLNTTAAFNRLGDVLVAPSHRAASTRVTQVLPCHSTEAAAKRRA